MTDDIINPRPRSPPELFVLFVLWAAPERTVLLTPPTADSGVSLLQLIGDRPPGPGGSSGPRVQVSFPLSPDPAPVVPALTHVPNPFYRHFSLIFNVRPSSPAAAVLFSITDGRQQLVYVGVKLSGERAGRQDVQFFYTEPGSERSYRAASFQVPSLVDSWTRFSLSVYEDQVTFYHGCEAEPQVVRFERSPDPMELDPLAGIFVGQAGKADGDRFTVKTSDFGFNIFKFLHRRPTRRSDPSDLVLGGSDLICVVRATCRS